VQVGTDPELSPRQRITSVPLAIRAEMAEKLDDTPRFQLDTGGTLPTGLVAYWKLDEASGTRADSIGSNNLTDNNTVTQAAGKKDNSAQFTEANSEYLSITDNAALSVEGQSFSIACWVYLDSKPSNAMVIAERSRSGGTVWEYGLVWDSAPYSKFRFDVNTTVSSLYATTFGSPSLSTWYFIVAWFDADANTVNIQVNDGTVDSVHSTGSVAPTTSIFSIGARTGSSIFFDGRIDELSFWKRVLTAQERSDLYNGGTGNTVLSPNSNPWVQGQAELLNRANHTGTQPASTITGTFAPSVISPQGSGSGLNADLVDGRHAGELLDRANHTGTQPSSTITGTFAPSVISPQGPGSGLDADTVDGHHASEFAQISHVHPHIQCETYAGVQSGGETPESWCQRSFRTWCLSAFSGELVSCGTRMGVYQRLDIICCQ